MRTVVLYDSAYGNTERVAKSLCETLAKSGIVLLLPVDDATLTDIVSPDLLVVGSPTHGGRPTPALEGFLKKIPSGSLKGVKVAAFDTRFDPAEHGLGLKVLMNVIRFAAGKIARVLILKGGEIVAEPEGFIVLDKEGPLKAGELERAARWADRLLQPGNSVQANEG